MRSALYFPNLRGKRGEIIALGHLSPVVRTWVRPTIDLPKPIAVSNQSIEDFLLDISSSVARNWGTAYPVFFDFSRYGPEETTSVGTHPAEYFFDLVRQHGVKGIPVAGPISVRGPGRRYLEAVSRAADRDRRGIGLRVPYHELSRPESLQAVLSDTLAALALPPDAVDVFLDLEALALLEPEERSEISVQAVVTDALRSLVQWQFRTVVMCGSSLPESLGKRHDWTPVHISRIELGVWRELLGRKDLPVVRFGDYGVVYPFESDADKFVRPPSRVRLCSPREHLIFRAKPDEYQTLCRVALRDESLVELPECWGAQALSTCARGAGNSGNATDWVARDTNIHLEATAQFVARNLGRFGLLSGIALESPHSMPWLQQALSMDTAG